MIRERLVLVLLIVFIAYSFLYNSYEKDYGPAETVRMDVIVNNTTFVAAHVAGCSIPSLYCYFSRRWVEDSYRTEIIYESEKIVSYNRTVYDSAKGRVNQTVVALVERKEITGHYLIFPDTKDYIYSVIKLL